MCLFFAGERESNSGELQSGSGLAPSEVLSGCGPSQASTSDLEDRLVSRITNLVATKLEEKYHTTATPFWKAFETSQPATTSEVVSEATAPPNQYGNEIVQNDMNDRFDCKLLLQLVPKPSKQKASELLNVFESRPNDITFDTKGVLYINSEAIPNSNMSSIFPALFKKRTKDINGLSEIITKLEQMDMVHLINKHNLKLKLKVDKPRLSQNANWWLLK